MQQESEYFCGECRDHFPTASSLLKHFVEHVSVKTERKLPDLVNISDEEVVNPVKYCLITMEENDPDKYKDGSGVKSLPTQLPDLKPIKRNKTMRQNV